MIFICGCSRPDAIIRERFITIDPIVLRDTLKAFETDTVITGLNIIKLDTVALIKYLPGRKEFIYKIKSDTIRIRHTDTVKVLHQDEKKDYSHWYYILGLLCVLSGIIYLITAQLKR